MVLIRFGNPTFYVPVGKHQRLDTTNEMIHTSAPGVEGDTSPNTCAAVLLLRRALGEAVLVGKASTRESPVLGILLGLSTSAKQSISVACRTLLLKTVGLPPHPNAVSYSFIHGAKPNLEQGNHRQKKCRLGLILRLRTMAVVR